MADEGLRSELRAAAADLRKLTDFGLVFESHIPETVCLPHHPIRRGVKVTYRDGTGGSIFEVARVNGDKVTMSRVRTADGAALAVQERADLDDETAELDALVVIAEFGDAIYPGLRHLGSVSRGGDRPAHVVIKGENHHALEALQFTHAGKIDCIYIDPPYNSGARDWKYSNDYVDADDAYRHSKWLAFMERRLKLAKALLNPENSVLIVTIDEKEYLRLGLLLEQTIPEAAIQMASIVTNPSGSVRPGRLARTDEYAFFVFVGDGELSPQYMAGVGRSASGPLPKVWETAIRSGAGTGVRASRPNLFYPVFVKPESLTVYSVGNPLDTLIDRNQVPVPAGTIPIWPIGQEGREQTWAFSHVNMQKRLAEGTARIANGKRGPSILYLQSGVLKKIEDGTFKIAGRRADGALDLEWGLNIAGRPEYPRTTWNSPSHSASSGGTRLLSSFLPGRSFPYPKSLYAVEDALRYVVGGAADAVILDFFAGSGTTAHAVMRLNKQDGGRRQCISVTNNEVSADEQKRLRVAGMRPGDSAWEQLGICDHITEPRIEAAITGLTPAGSPVTGDYRFTDEFPMAEGFEENVEFFELTYLDAGRVEVNLAFAGIAPLLWLRAGGRGPIIDGCVNGNGRRKPYAWTDRYGVLFNTDRWRGFVSKLPATATTVFIVTDSTTEFAHIAGELPGHLDVVRLYERYLTTFAINER